ncbi:MAG: hypothetical protein R2875_03395 [Desulfobacterales bacterium]
MPDMRSAHIPPLPDGEFMTGLLAVAAMIRFGISLDFPSILPLSPPLW